MYVKTKVGKDIEVMQNKFCFVCACLSRRAFLLVGVFCVLCLVILSSRSGKDTLKPLDWHVSPEYKKVSIHCCSYSAFKQIYIYVGYMGPLIKKGLCGILQSDRKSRKYMNQ